MTKKLFCKEKSFLISLISIFLLIQILVWNLIDIFGNLNFEIQNNEGVDYDLLRKYLSSSFPLFFLTDQTILFFSFTGSLYFWFHKRKNYKTILFCSISFLVFNIFALVKYKWSTFLVVPYSTYKTMMSHFFIPVISFAILFSIRKDIILWWKPLLACSFYLTFYILLSMTIYFSISYIDTNGQTQNLKIYWFLDFNNKIMCFHTYNQIWKVFLNMLLVLVTPLASLTIFIIFKSIYNIKIESVKNLKECLKKQKIKHW